jgi:hypothetical protein
MQSFNAASVGFFPVVIASGLQLIKAETADSGTGIASLLLNYSFK